MLYFDDRRFEISETQALLNLFNKTNATDFTIDEMSIVQIRPIPHVAPPESGIDPTILLNPNTAIQLRIERDEVVVMDEPIVYSRLDVLKYIPVWRRYVWDRGLGAVGVLASIQERLHIQFSNQYVEVSEVTIDTNLVFYRITMTSDNPAWVGSILFESVSEEDEEQRDSEAASNSNDPLPWPPVTPEVYTDVDGDRTSINFTTAATTWTAPHTLDGYPDVTCLDNQGHVIVGEINYSSSSSVIVTWDQPQSGKIILR